MDEAIQEFLSLGTSLTELSRKYNVDRLKLSRIFKKDYDISDIKKYCWEKRLNFYELCYQEWIITAVPYNDFCKLKHISTDRFRDYIASRNNPDIVWKDKYHVNENIFRSIDSEEKAYWLGFLMADGYNSGQHIALTIQYRDFNHLKKFRNFMSSNARIRFRSSDHTVTINICSKQICNDLNKLGVVKGKTYCGSYPCYQVMPKQYTRDFIRGFLDGDGCIGPVELHDLVHYNSYHRKIDKVSFRIMSLRFAQRLVKEITRLCHIKVGIYQMLNQNNISEVYIEGQSAIRTFLDYMYKDATVYLDRKFARYLKYILPSDLEIDRIISARLSENALPNLDWTESIIEKAIRTEGDVNLNFSNVVDCRKTGQGQRIETDTI